MSLRFSPQYRLSRTVRYAALALVLGASAGPARAATFPLPLTGNVVGEIQVIAVSKDSTLLDVARHYDLGSEEIAWSNPGVDMWLPKDGQRVVVPTEFILPPKPWTGIVVNVGARRFFYFPPPKHGERPVVITYPLGIARDHWPTPIGHTRIAAKVRNPSWAVPKDILAEHLKDGDPLPKVVPPGPNNPMGLLALRTAMPGIYIHGTNQPWGVGDRVSHGCMHLYPEDVAQIFPEVPVGTPVRIFDLPFQVGERDGVLYMAGYRPIEDYHNPKSPLQRAVDAVIDFVGEKQILIDWDRVEAVAKTETSVPTPISPGAPDLAQIIAQIPVQQYNFPPYGVDANTAAPPPAAARNNVAEPASD